MVGYVCSIVLALGTKPVKCCKICFKNLIVAQIVGRVFQEAVVFLFLSL